MADSITDAHLKSLLDGMDVALNELIARQQPSFFIAHYAAGRALATQGKRFLDSPTRDAASLISTIDALPQALEPSTRFDVIGDMIDRVADALERTIAALRQRGDAEIKTFLDNVVDWEIALFAHREQPAAAFAEREARPPAITADTLLNYLCGRFPAWTGLEVTSFRPLIGGFSKATLLFETNDNVNGPQALVARVAPLHNFLNFESYELDREYGVIRYAFEAGLPIAEPILLEDDPAKLGSRFLISRMALGRTIGTVKAVAEPLSDEMVAEIARVLARIHNLPIDSDNALVRRSHLPRWLTPDLRTNTAMLIEDWRQEVGRSKIDPSPSVTRALTWLADNIPHVQGKPSLLHGDFGVHNFLIDNGRITALLDWEVSRAGDPADDITYFMMGSGDLFREEDLLRHYVAAGGAPIDRYRLRYFDVYQCMKMIVACLAALSQVERWESVGITHAVFGLRYLTFSAKRMNALIDAAEAARPRT